MATSQPPNQVDAMRDRMLRLRGDIGGGEPARNPALEETFEAFGVTLEELRAAEEHLIDANELLLTTRHQLDSERRRYRELFDLAPVGYLVTDPAGVILDANRAAAGLLNVPQRFMAGKILANFVPEADRRAFRLALAKAGGDTPAAPWRVGLKPRHGDVVEVEVSVAAGVSTTEKGPDLLWLVRRPTAVGVDRGASAAGERDRLRALIDNVGVVLWEADPATGRLTFLSREIEAFLGEPAATWLDAPDGLAGRVHPDDRGMFQSLRSRQLNDRTELEMEYRLLAPGGHPIWVRDVSRFSPGTGGTPEALRGVLVNVNKRKRVERRLYYSRVDAESRVFELELLQDLCERLTRAVAPPDVVASIVAAVTALLGSDMGTVSLCNPDSTGARVAGSVGLTDEFLAFLEASRPEDVPCYRALLECRNVVFGDVEADPAFAPALDVYRRAGVRAAFAAPLLSSAGEALGVLSIYFREPHSPPDRQQSLVELYARQAGQLLSNARRLAAVLASEGERDEFLAVLGHELRSPLSAMYTALYLLEVADADAPVRREVFDTLVRQTRYMSRLVDDLMDFVRIGQGQFLLRTEPIDPTAAVVRAVEIVRPVIEAAKHTVTLDFPAEPLLTTADPIRLTQVVVNVLNNSAKYTPPGGTIAVSLGRERDRLQLRVVDNGAGVASSLLPRVFDRFTQGETAPGPTYRGLGIGLTLVKKLVELQGGTVSLTSPGVGKGCEVTVTFPLLGGAPPATPDPST